MRHVKSVVKAREAMPAGEIWLRVIPEFVVGLPRKLSGPRLALRFPHGPYSPAQRPPGAAV